MASSTSDDRSLHRRLLRREQAAQRELVERHWEPLCALLAHQVGLTRHDAEEIASEVLCEVLVEPERYDPDRGAMRTWLAVSARNRARDVLRRRSRRPTPVPLPHDLRNRPDSASASGSVARAAELLVHVCKEVLSPQDRRILWWWAYDVPYDRMAEWTGHSPGALRQRVRRAKLAIRRVLDGLADEFPALADPAVRRHLDLEGPAGPGASA